MCTKSCTNSWLSSNGNQQITLSKEHIRFFTSPFPFSSPSRTRLSFGHFLREDNTREPTHIFFTINDVSNKDKSSIANIRTIHYLCSTVRKIFLTASIRHSSCKQKHFYLQIEIIPTADRKENRRRQTGKTHYRISLMFLHE